MVRPRQLRNDQKKSRVRRWMEFLIMFVITLFIVLLLALSLLMKHITLHD